MYYSTEKVKALAALTRLQISDEEALRLARELDAMRALADGLEDVDGEERDLFWGAVSPDALREDVASVDQRLEPSQFAPVTAGGYIVVPRAVED